MVGCSLLELHACGLQSCDDIIANFKSSVDGLVSCLNIVHIDLFFKDLLGQRIAFAIVGRNLMYDSSRREGCRGSAKRYCSQKIFFNESFFIAPENSLILSIFFMHIYAAIHFRFIGHEDLSMETPVEYNSSKIVL